MKVPIRIGLRALTRVALAGVIGLACSEGQSPGARDPGGKDGTGDDVTDETPVVHSSQCNIVLGRPTDTSIALSVLAGSAGDRALVEYGTDLSADQSALAGNVSTADAVTSSSGEPIVLQLSGLAPDQRYFYRVRYQAAGGAYVSDSVHSFRTRRAPGSTFAFGVQGDTHPERLNDKMFNGELLALTMDEVRNRQPDFYFMIGDDFSIEKVIQDFKDANFEADHAFKRSVEGSMSFADYQASILHPFERPMIVDGVGAPPGNAGYRAYRERWLGVMSNATALFLVNGNHEQAHAANLGGIFNNAAVWAADGRLKYYPLPAPDGFYSGDRTPLVSVNGYPTIEALDGLLRDYYAFAWGDALFVTIDPYWHSPLVGPDSPLFDGEAVVDKWAATMGDEQYAWLKQTLETSTARWKFVFAHHINGTGRGGAASVGAQEWGGKLSDFASHRPTWAKPIHQLFVDTGVTVFFQGHDHVFARERVDGVVYQSLPNPADNSYFTYNCSVYASASVDWKGPAGYGNYDADDTVVMPNSGFVYVTVSPSVVRLQYVRTYRSVDLATDPNHVFSGAESNGEVAFSYSIPPQPGDDQAEDHRYACIGDAPPAGWTYNP